MSRLNSGSLTLVGIGYLPGGHVSIETLAYIKGSDNLFFLAEDPLTQQWLLGLKPGAKSLLNFARKGRSLVDCCDDMVTHLLHEVRGGRTVCVAFAGHPGVGVHPANQALKLARKEGLKVQMIPAISAVDCLFADLGFDPRYGCQIFAADCLLARPCRLDPHSALIVFQPATIGITRYRAGGRVSRAGVRQLVERLLEFYPADHDVVIYEAASYPVVGPRMEHIPLTRLPKAMLTPISTLFVPPFGRD